MPTDVIFRTVWLSLDQVRELLAKGELNFDATQIYIQFKDRTRAQQLAGEKPK